jgi:hypothetical protein
MSRPGDFVRRTATRVCSERMRRRLIDPAVADLQAEVAEARRTGSTWRLLQSLTAGYLSVAKVLVIAACGEFRQHATTWERHEVAGVVRAALIAGGTISVATLLLALPFIVQSSYPNPGWLAVYLIPSTLPVSVPLGFAVATAWALHGAARTRRVASVVLFTAALTSAAMFVNMVRVVPDANQAFREAVAAKLNPAGPAPRRGSNELRLTELRVALREAQALGRDDEAWQLETTYYRKWTLSVTPLAIVGLVVALGFTRRWTRRRLTVTACGVFFVVHFPLWTSAGMLSSVARPMVIEGAGPALCAAVSLLVTCWRSRAPRPA